MRCLVAAAKWLDRGPLHAPLLLAAAAGALLALGTLVKENRDRNECIAKGSCITVSPREKRHNW